MREKRNAACTGRHARNPAGARRPRARPSPRKTRIAAASMVSHWQRRSCSLPAAIISVPPGKGAGGAKPVFAEIGGRRGGERDEPLRAEAALRKEACKAPVLRQIVRDGSGSTGPGRPRRACRRSPGHPAGAKRRAGSRCVPKRPGLPGRSRRDSPPHGAEPVGARGPTSTHGRETPNVTAVRERSYRLSCHRRNELNEPSESGTARPTSPPHVHGGFQDEIRGVRRTPARDFRRARRRRGRDTAPSQVRAARRGAWPRRRPLQHRRRSV